MGHPSMIARVTLFFCLACGPSEEEVEATHQESEAAVEELAEGLEGDLGMIELDDPLADPLAEVPEGSPEDSVEDSEETIQENASE